MAVFTSFTFFSLLGRQVQSISTLHLPCATASSARPPSAHSRVLSLRARRPLVVRKEGVLHSLWDREINLGCSNKNSTSHSVPPFPFSLSDCVSRWGTPVARDTKMPSLCGMSRRNRIWKTGIDQPRNASVFVCRERSCW